MAQWHIIISPLLPPCLCKKTHTPQIATVSGTLDLARLHRLMMGLFERCKKCMYNLTGVTFKLNGLAHRYLFF